MSKILTIQIDVHEPDWIQDLKFDGVPVAKRIPMLTGDLIADTDDGHRIVVERKTVDDFLNTLGSNDPNHQLFIQLARMVQPRYEQQHSGQPLTYWAYLVITSPFITDGQGKIITDRGVTNWDLRDVEGAKLKLQEMGVFVTHAENEADYEDCILRIGKRDRSQIMKLLPARVANILGNKSVFIQSLSKGIGIETTQKILDYCGNIPAHALVGITDLSIKFPLGDTMRKNVRDMLGLEENETIEIYQKEITNAQEKPTTEK